MKLLIVAAFLTVVHGSALLGSRKCTWGPTYWCGHLANAKECGALGHCMQTVWTKQKAPRNTSLECELCEMMVNQSRLLFKNGCTEEVLKFIDSSCDFLPWGESYKNECHDVVQLADYLMSLLKSNMTAQQVCSTFLPCAEYSQQMKTVKNVRVETNEIPLVDLVTPVEVTAVQSYKGDICVDCKAFIQDIKDKITDPATENQIITLLKSMVCSQMKSLEPLCDDGVDTMVPQVLQRLANYVEPDVFCTAGGFCQALLQKNVGGAYDDIKSWIDFLKKYFAFHDEDILMAVECDGCKSIVGTLDNMIRDLTIQDKIENFIDKKICSFMGDLEQECKEEVKNNAVALFALLAGTFSDGQTICSNIKMCPAVDYMTVMTVDSYPSNAKNFECKACSGVLGVFRLLASAYPVQIAIKDLLKNKVCPRLGSSEKACVEDVEHGVPVVMKLLEEFLADQKYLCSKMNMCPVTYKQMKKQVKGNTLCSICEIAVEEIDNYLTKKKTEQEIEDLLNKVCDKLASGAAQECKEFVSQYVPDVISILREADPKTVCTKLNLCTSMVEIINSAPPKAQPYVTRSRVSDDTMCIACKYAVTEVDNLLKANKTEAEIKAALDAVCNDLGSIAEECQQLVDQYLPSIIALLLQEASPDTVCTSLSLCSSATKFGAPKAQPYVTRSRVSDDTMCTMCKYAVTQVDNLLKANKTEAEIKAALDAVCNDLGSIAEECQQLVDQYLPSIIALLLQEASPDTVCTTLSLCSSATKFGAPKENKASSAECVLCEFVMNELDSMLKKNASKADIESALQKVCSLLPATITTECTAFVSIYSKEILNILLQELDPKTVCTKLNLCSQSSNKDMSNSLLVKPVKDNPVCVVCELVMNEIANYLKDNKTIGEIEGLLKKVCNVLPSNLSAQCQDFINEYAPAVLALLEADFNPDEICKGLTLCPQSIPVKKPMVSLLESPNRQKSVKAADFCLLCEEIVTYVHLALEQPGADEFIKEILDEVCNNLPLSADAKDECDTLVSTFGGEIVNFLKNNTDPYTVCPALGLCSSRVSPKTVVNQLKVEKAKGISLAMKEIKPAAKNILKTLKKDEKLYFKRFSKMRSNHMLL